MATELPSPLPGPEPFTAEELAGAKKLGQLLDGQLPVDLCTNFVLARHLRAAKGNSAEAEQRLRYLAAHMQAFGIDKLEQTPQLGIGQPFARPIFDRFAISCLEPSAGDVFSDDLLVFVQSMDGVDIKKILRVVPLGHALETYFQLQLNWMRAIVERERRTGRPAAAVTIIDLKGLPLRDFVNPLSPASRMARLIVRLWAEYFTENLVRLFLVNPPSLLSLFWQVLRHIMDQRTWAKLVVVHHGRDLLAHLQASAVPEIYGGSRRDDSGFSASPSSCMSAPRPVLPSELFAGPESWWAQQQPAGVQRPMPEWLSVILGNPKEGVAAQHESQPIECLPGDRILWMFTTNGELQFEMVCRPRESNQEEPVWPRNSVCSLSVPEHGNVECRRAGLYWARFTGSATAGWLISQAIKVNYFVHRMAKEEIEGTIQS